MASAPTRVSHATQGMRWMRPPRCPRLRSPVACNTAPVPRNSRLFMNAWFIAWYMTAIKVSAAAARMSAPVKTIASPSPVNKIPTFSMDE